SHRYHRDLHAAGYRRRDRHIPWNLTHLPARTMVQFCSFRLLKSVLAVLLTGALAGCVGAPQSAALLASWDEQALPLHSPILLDNVPFFAQDEYQCGPAALATVLVADGVEVTPEELVDQVYVPARQGSLQIEMLAAPRRM